MPLARSTTTATPGTSCARNASAGADAPISNVRSDVMQTSAKSTPSSAAASAGSLMNTIGMRLQRRTDLLVGARDLDRAGHDRANTADRLPFGRERFVAPGLRDRRETVRDARSARCGSRAAQLSSRGEDEDRRQPYRDGAEDMVDRLQRAAPLGARRRLAIERVLADVEIEGGEIGVHERRQRRDHARIIEAGVGRARRWRPVRPAGAASTARVRPSPARPTASPGA